MLFISKLIDSQFLTLKLLDIGLPVTTHKGSVNVDPGAKRESQAEVQSSECRNLSSRSGQKVIQQIDHGYRQQNQEGVGRNPETKNKPGCGEAYVEGYKDDPERTTEQWAHALRRTRHRSVVIN